MAIDASPPRKVFLHPELSLMDPFGLHESRWILSRQHRSDILVTIDAFSKGLAKRNRDYKYLAGFKKDRLFELRWELQFDCVARPLRLIGSEISDSAVILLSWHIKDPTLSSETQRGLMNLARQKALERKNTIDTTDR
jgi:hypothetical protein